MKTGTPPRVDGRSLDFERMEVQHGDPEVTGFSYLEQASIPEQRPCHIAHTNAAVHEILRDGFADSPMFTGRIQGLGPRYCPSIEEKIDRFADKEQHQLFVEPEGWDTVEYYINGFSTSLPEAIQFKALRQVPGFENVRFFRPGYAIEYDYFPPTQLKNSLETKHVHGLFFAGQINGTTGYEEAGCQGLMAGINAHRHVKEEEALVLARNEAYIGVLIDDLINKGTDEPYRMFTSRAEFRLLLRQDNADVRLTPMAHAMGLASQHRLDQVNEKVSASKHIRQFLDRESVNPETINPLLEQVGSSPTKQTVRLSSILARPQITLSLLAEHLPALQGVLVAYPEASQTDAEINLKYAGYLEKEMEMAAKMTRLERIPVPSNFDFTNIVSLSIEAREKLGKIKPQTLGQASRISGITPADMSVLLVYLGR